MTGKPADDRLFRIFQEIAIIHQLTAALMNRRLPEGLHVSHFATLNHLVRLGDGRTPVDLARAFQVTKGTMTHTLSELARRGLIELRPNATDGRSKVVILTSAGRSFHREAIARVGPIMAKLSREMDTSRVLAILPVLEGLRAVLDANRDTEIDNA